MSHAVGVTEVLTELPDPVVVGFALVTQLGDFWFVFSVCALAYWLGPHAPVVGRGLTRDRAATVVALLAAAVALTVSLKAVVAHPRPVTAGTAPEAALLPTALRGVYGWLATGDGFTFPSGHATVATLVWGGLAWAVRVGDRRRRIAVAASVILLICLSRLVLGVHYLLDVVAGVALGGATLWLAVTRLRTPARIFALAAAVALAGLALVGPTHDVAAAVGLTVAGFAVCVLGPDVPAPTRRGAVATTGLGVVSVGTLLVAALGAASSSLGVGLLAAGAAALLLVLPLAGERVAKKR